MLGKYYFTYICIFLNRTLFFTIFMFCCLYYINLYFILSLFFPHFFYCLFYINVSAATLPSGQLMLNPISWKQRSVDPGCALSFYDITIPHDPNILMATSLTYLFRFSNCADRLNNIVTDSSVKNGARLELRPVCTVVTNSYCSHVNLSYVLYDVLLVYVIPDTRYHITC